MPIFDLLSNPIPKTANYGNFVYFQALKSKKREIFVVRGKLTTLIPHNNSIECDFLSDSEAWR